MGVFVTELNRVATQTVLCVNLIMVLFALTYVTFT